MQRQNSNEYKKRHTVQGAGVPFCVLIFGMYPFYFMLYAITV